MIKYLFVITLLLMSCDKKKNIYVSMETQLGNIIIELYPKKAPITVQNFLKYINENRYEDFHFYRTVHLNNQPNNKIKIEVIQGGLGLNKHPLTLPPIIHESTNLTKIKHLDGTISMARLEPGTASSEIFICINNQKELDFGGQRNLDKQGFAAFGKVISGMDIVKNIHSQNEDKQLLDNFIQVNNIKLKGIYD